MVVVIVLVVLGMGGGERGMPTYEHYCKSSHMHVTSQRAGSENP